MAARCRARTVLPRHPDRRRRGDPRRLDDDVRLFAIFLDDYHVRKLQSMSVRDPLRGSSRRQLGPSDMIGLMYPLQSVLNLRMTRNHGAIIQGIQKFTGRNTTTRR